MLRWRLVVKSEFQRSKRTADFWAWSCDNRTLRLSWKCYKSHCNRRNANRHFQHNVHRRIAYHFQGTSSGRQSSKVQFQSHQRKSIFPYYRWHCRLSSFHMDWDYTDQLLLGSHWDCTLSRDRQYSLVCIHNYCPHHNKHCSHIFHHKDQQWHSIRNLWECQSQKEVSLYIRPQSQE